MSYNNLVILLYIIIVTYTINRGLNVEGIVNGLDAHQEFFKYQTAVLGRYNFSNAYYFICGGGIISSKIVLSAAHCFVDKHGNLKNMSLTIAAGTDDLNLNEGIREDVAIIYLPPDLDDILHNDIAALQLRKRWRLKNSSFLMKLYLPTVNESLGRKAAVVAGFGFNTVKTKRNKETGIRFRIGGSSDYRLRFGNIYIVTNNSCKIFYPNANITIHICGLMIPNPPKPRAGTCSGDSGSPLVHQNKIVGIVSRSSIDCDDTAHACRYTRVSAFRSFITNIIAGTPAHDTVIIMNHPHILRPPMI